MVDLNGVMVLNRTKAMGGLPRRRVRRGHPANGPGNVAWLGLAARILLAGYGFDNVEILDGGFLAWPFETHHGV